MLLIPFPICPNFGYSFRISLLHTHEQRGKPWDFGSSDLEHHHSPYAPCAKYTYEASGSESPVKNRSMNIFTHLKHLKYQNTSHIPLIYI